MGSLIVPFICDLFRFIKSSTSHILSFLTVYNDENTATHFSWLQKKP